MRQHLRQSHPEASESKRLCGHLRTLAGMVAGIVASGRTSLQTLGLKAPDRTKPQSRTKRFERFVRNKHVTVERFYEPFGRALLEELSSEGAPLLIAFDSSSVGQGRATFMASVLYQKRALPVAWRVKEGAKGSFSSADHRSLLKRVRELIPEEATAIFLGDGEFDSTGLQRVLDEMGFSYVCRTSCSTLLEEQSGAVYPIGELRSFGGQRYASVPGASVTRKRYGPLQVVLWHEEKYEDPVPLMTNLELAEEAIRYYRRRPQIETLFSDQKSRGFHMHKSHISRPERLARVLMAAALAYVWMIYLGAESLRHGWQKQFHCTSRVDLGLFQLGVRMMDYILNQGWALQGAFSLPPRDPPESVR